jgi:hypothetical protein
MAFKIMNHPNWHPYYGREELGADVVYTVCVHDAVVDKSFFKTGVVDKRHGSMEICKNLADWWVVNKLVFVRVAI